MIKITSYYLFSNFLRITQNFLEDEISVKAKSLTAERSYEVRYRDIAQIVYRNYSNDNQMNFGLMAVGFTSLIFLFFIPGLNENFFAQKIGQVIFTTGWILFFTGFSKLKHCFLIDKNDNLLTAIQITPSTEDDANLAIELIHQKSKITNETNPKSPFPESEPVFEFIDYDIPDNINKSTTRFYKTELIDHEKSLTDEVVTRVKFSELSPRTTRGSRGNSNWTSVGCNLMYVSLAIMAFPGIFNLPANKITFISCLIPAILSVIAFLLRFVKEEIVYFENLENRTVHSMRITKRNKEKVGQILQYVEQRTNKKKPALKRTTKTKLEKKPK